VPDFSVLENEVKLWRWFLKRVSWAVVSS